MQLHLACAGVQVPSRNVGISAIAGVLLQGMAMEWTSGVHGSLNIPDRLESISGLPASFPKDVCHLLRLRSQD